MAAPQILNNFSLYILFETCVANPNPKIMEKIYGAAGLYINLRIYIYNNYVVILFGLTNRCLNRIMNYFGYIFWTRHFC